jgi:hypothetical protein
MFLLDRASARISPRLWLRFGPQHDDPKPDFIVSRLHCLNTGTRRQGDAQHDKLTLDRPLWAVIGTKVPGGPTASRVRCSPCLVDGATSGASRSRGGGSTGCRPLADYRPRHDRAHHMRHVSALFRSSDSDHGSLGRGQSQGSSRGYDVIFSRAGKGTDAGTAQGTFGPTPAPSKGSVWGDENQVDSRLRHGCAR